MKVASITGPSQARVIELPVPKAGADDAIVAVGVAPMCTEYQAFQRGDLTHSLGHEAVGTVVEAGPDRLVAAGDRVIAMPLLGCGTCDLCRSGWYIYCERVGNLEPGEKSPGTMAEYISKPPHLLVPIPDDISDHHASMACCGLGASFGAFERLQVSALDTVLVTGLGPVGLGAVVNAVHRGARVVAVESNSYRAQLAVELGAVAVLDPADDVMEGLRDLTEGRLADVAIECSGAVPAHRTAIRGVRRLGSVAFVGNSYRETPIVVSDDLLHRGVTLLGSWHYNLGSASRLLRQIRDIPAQLDRLITHTFPLDAVQQAWETQVAGDCGKVLLDVSRGA